MMPVLLSIDNNLPRAFAYVDGARMCVTRTHDIRDEGACFLADDGLVLSSSSREIQNPEARAAVATALEEQFPTLPIFFSGPYGMELWTHGEFIWVRNLID